MIFVKHHFKKVFFNVAVAYELTRLVNEKIKEYEPKADLKKEEKHLKQLLKIRESYEGILAAPLEVPTEDIMRIYNRAAARADRIFKKWALKHYYVNGK